MRQKMERLINGLLWIIILIFGSLALKDWVQDNYVPDPFVQPETHAPALVKLTSKVDRPDGTWVEAHFVTPVPLMGEIPEHWSEIEASLDPAQCGVCHPAQYETWKQSWHALGMGPGTMGQLVDQTPEYAARCQRCHANLAEQYAVLDGEENPHFDESLQTAGVTCAGCHVRDWARIGPPNPLAPLPEAVEGEEPPRRAHDGFVGRAEFQDSLFCESCHDFGEGERRVKDKYLQETYEEWRRTDYAEQGTTCQSCHMPGGEHSFKGIHDPELVKSGMTVEAELKALGEGFMEPVMATLTVTNTGVGHRMPTYVTPRIVLVMEQVNAAGEPIEGTRQEGFIGRDVGPMNDDEVYDTRLLPDESFSLEYEAELHPQAVQLDARVEVWPDEGYTRAYSIWTEKRPEDHAKGLAQLEEALQHSLDSQYVAWEQTVAVGAR